MSYLNTTKRSALSAAKNLRGANRKFQAAVGYIVAQLLNGNSDSIDIIMRAAEMITYNAKGELYTTSHGKTLFRYITDTNGLNVPLVRWDDEANRFKMADGWKDKAAKIDMDKLENLLANTWWHEHGKEKAARAFDLDRAILTLIRKAKENGADVATVRAHFEKVALKAA